MKSYFAYIRVSTVKQGEYGSSLSEQRDAITNFAARHGLQIGSWFEERETAAKIGRREFSRMVVALKKGKASGVIFHKIDRSARNLKDWSAVQDLADLGIDVRFTQESINLGTNEGKLTGDFLAVISAHYIRNLREEVRKGIRGRLKQGLYPFKAFTGYLDRGGGKPKTPDPERAPFICMAFELYSTGQFSLHSLADELYARGFRSNTNKMVGVNRLAEILRNPFYIGIIRMKGSGESYIGVHQPIVSKSLFSRVQDVLDGKLSARPLVHDFLFRRMITCTHCKYSLIGETRKGHVYYRCHSRTCPTVSIREEVAEATILAHLTPLGLSAAEAAEMKERAISMRADTEKNRENQTRAVNLRMEVTSGRLARLMDVYLDGAVDRQVFEEKKLALLTERKGLEEERDRIARGEKALVDRLLEYLGQLETLSASYEMANPIEKRKLVKTTTSDLCGDGKNLCVELKSPFREVANLTSVRFGGPLRGRPRTKVQKIFNLLVKHCKAHAEERQREEETLIAA
jgi:DNA invertase Pin-like site-specific DNA recombinase